MTYKFYFVIVKERMGGYGVIINSGYNYYLLSC